MLVDPYKAYRALKAIVNQLALIKFLIGDFETLLSNYPQWSLTFITVIHALVVGH